MEIFQRMCQREHEQLVFWNEPRIGYKGIIAIHNTTLGPALGGTRFWNYATDDEAIEDFTMAIALDGERRETSVEHFKVSIAAVADVPDLRVADAVGGLARVARHVVELALAAGALDQLPRPDHGGVQVSVHPLAVDPQVEAVGAGLGQHQAPASGQHALHPVGQLL